MKQPIELKGSGTGLVIQANENLDHRLFLETLETLLEEGGDFFKGGRVVGLTGVDYSYVQKAEIERLLERGGLRVVSLEHPTRAAAVEPEPEQVETVVPEIPCGSETKLIKGTLRSGNRVDHHGDVVIFGDVNPGAEVYSEGNVIVLGKLRGIAHAGASGNTSAFIVAMDFRPTQLRIATTITRPPEEPPEGENYPEIAYLNDKGQMVLEPVN